MHQITFNDKFRDRTKKNWLLKLFIFIVACQDVMRTEY